MEHHEAADLFPMMVGEEFAAFKESIRVNGQSETIKLLDGKLLDGRNRELACKQLGIVPRTEELPSDTDPWRYVAIHNWDRRHLSESQRGMVAAKLANMKQGGDRGNQHTGGKRSKEHLPQSPVTNDEAAAILNVSEMTVRRAKKVRADAIPEIVKMVEQGEVKVATAQTVSKLPKADQKKAAAAGPEGVRKAARKNGGRKKQPRREATIPATEEEAVANVGAIDDLLAKWESMPGFRKMLAQWEDRKRWTFCDKIESLSRTLRKLATDLRHPKG